MVLIMQSVPSHSAKPNVTFNQKTDIKVADNGSTEANKLTSEAEMNFVLSK